MCSKRIMNIEAREVSETIRKTQLSASSVPLEACLEGEPLIDEPRGPMAWDLVLSHEYSYSFADSKGYQARVAELEARE